MTLNHTASSYFEILSNPKMKLREKTKFKIIEEIAMEDLTIIAQPNNGGLYNLYRLYNIVPSLYR